MVLIVVTITIILLTMAAWSYSSQMLIEFEASAMTGREANARLAAESGIEIAATRVMDRDLETGAGFLIEMPIKFPMLSDAPAA